VRILEWRDDYNQSRPHSSLDWMSPEEYHEYHQPYNPTGTTNLNLAYQTGEGQCGLEGRVATGEQKEKST